MTASANSGVPEQRGRNVPSRYDLVLAVIPTAFVVALLASIVFSIPLRAVLTASSLVGALALVDGLYRNPPIDGV